MKKAVFLDRDGVVTEEVDYLYRPEDTLLTATIADAVKLIHRNGRLAVVVTNQAGIARKMYTAADMESVHARIQTLLLKHGADAVIDAFYFCPHHPDFTGICDCRKPAAGMLLKAGKDFDIDMANSFMIGDRMSDLKAGVAAGCRGSALVLTGYGVNEKVSAGKAGFTVAENVLEAVKYFLPET